MPNTTPESLLMQAVKPLIAGLSNDERARLHPWILACFDVQGQPQKRL
jgi:hypothetical protein